MKAARTYFSSPSTENALELYSVLPKTQIRGENEDFSKGSIFLKVDHYIFENLPLLEKQVLKPDRNAVKVAVRLWTIADGAFGEWLSEMLGELIRVDPKMFLEELSCFPWRYRDLVDFLREDHIVCTGGILSGLATDSKAVREELEMRVKALETVKHGDLLVTKLRDECITIIKKEMQRAKMECLLII